MRPLAAPSDNFSPPLRPSLALGFYIMAGPHTQFALILNARPRQGNREKEGEDWGKCWVGLRANVWYSVVGAWPIRAWLLLTPEPFCLLLTSSKCGTG